MALAFTGLLWRVRLTRYYIVLWVLVFLLGASLAATASQALAASKGLQLFFHRCGNLLRDAFEALIRLVVRVALAAVIVIEVIALAFAAPIFLLRGRDLPAIH